MGGGNERGGIEREEREGRKEGEVVHRDVSLLYAGANDVAMGYEYLQGRRPCAYSHGIG